MYGILWPRIPVAPPRIRIQLVHEARPATAHQIRQVGVALRLPLEGIYCVESVAIEVEENECNFVEVGRTWDLVDAGGDRVEAVAVGRYAVRGPSLTG